MYTPEEMTKIQNDMSYEGMLFRTNTALMTGGKHSIVKQIMDNIEYVHENEVELKLIGPYTY